MPLPHSFTNVGNPLIDATQFNDNFTWVDTGKYREFTVTGVPCDATTTAILFPTPFASSVGAISFGVEGYNGTDKPVLSTPLISNKTLNGFSVTIGGGQSGTTITLHVRANGS